MRWIWNAWIYSLGMWALTTLEKRACEFPQTENMVTFRHYHIQTSIFSRKFFSCMLKVKSCACWWGHMITTKSPERAGIKWFHLDRFVFAECTWFLKLYCTLTKRISWPILEFDFSSLITCCTIVLLSRHNSIWEANAFTQNVVSLSFTSLT